MLQPRRTAAYSHMSQRSQRKNVVAQGSAVIVTGGKGFLGRFVVDELANRGYENIIALGSSDCDLVDAAATDDLFARIRPAGVIHAAAAVGGIGANKDNPGWFSYANSVMGANVLESARRHGADKVVSIGTICVYPGDAPVPTPESAMFAGFPAGDTAPYGIAKRNLWMMGTAYREQYGLNAVFLIPTNLFGPHDHFEESRSHVIPALIRRFIDARENGDPEVVIWGDGSATREFLYVSDAARGIVDALERYDASDPVNLGTGYEVSIKALAEEIREQVGYTGRLTWDTSKPTGAPRRSLAVERAKERLGFEANVSLEEGLRQTIEWYENERKGE